MCGIMDPCAPSLDSNLVNEKHVSNSARRLFGFPVFSSITSTMSNAYSSIKQSHVTVASVLNATEEGLGKGFEMVSPITETIGSTLETPLKSVDNVVCMGLDFLEENVPMITRSSTSFIDMMGTYFRFAEIFFRC